MARLLEMVYGVRQKLREEFPVRLRERSPAPEPSRREAAARVQRESGAYPARRSAQTQREAYAAFGSEHMRWEGYAASGHERMGSREAYPGKGYGARPEAYPVPGSEQTRQDSFRPSKPRDPATVL